MTNKWTITVRPAIDEPGYWLAFARNNHNPLDSIWTHVLTTKEKAQHAANILYDQLALNGHDVSLPTADEDLL